MCSRPLFDSTREYFEQIDAYRAFQGKPEAEDEVLWHRRKYECSCAVCGQTFISCRAESQYCSDKCKHAARRQRLAAGNGMA